MVIVLGLGSGLALPELMLIDFSSCLYPVMVLFGILKSLMLRLMLWPLSGDLGFTVLTKRYLFNLLLLLSRALVEVLIPLLEDLLLL